MSDVQFWIDLRNQFQGVVEVIDAKLSGVAPEADGTVDFNSLTWKDVEGSKQPYEQTTREANKTNTQVFEELQKQLEDAGGFWQNKTHKYWFHQNRHDTIDRRAKESS
jgi:hypothetical protein